MIPPRRAQTGGPTTHRARTESKARPQTHAALPRIVPPPTHAVTTPHGLSPRALVCGRIDVHDTGISKRISGMLVPGSTSSFAQCGHCPRRRPPPTPVPSPRGGGMRAQGTPAGGQQRPAELVRLQARPAVRPAQHTPLHSRPRRGHSCKPSLEFDSGSVSLS